MTKTDAHDVDAVCMGFDAMRILTGHAPRRFSAADIAAMFAEIARREATSSAGELGWVSGEDMIGAYYADE